MTSTSGNGRRLGLQRGVDLVRDPERTTPLALTGLRVLFGLLWVQSAGWKVPPDFVALRNQTVNAIDHEVFAPWAWIVEHLVLEHFSVFGWITFLAEAGLGATLLVGIWTRASALAGAGLSLLIALSALNTPGEWGWAYWMLIAGHLVLAAVGPGSTYGLDALRCPARGRVRCATAGRGAAAVADDGGRRGGNGRSVPIVVLASALAMAVYALIASHTVGFTADRGRIVLLRNDDWFMGDLVQLNGLGALLYGMVAAVGLLGVVRRSATLTSAATSGFVVLGLQVLVQFGRDTNWLGAQRGGNLAVCAAAVLTLVLTPRVIPRAPHADPAGPADPADPAPAADPAGPATPADPARRAGG